jgi:hypothetical protein
MSKRCAGSLSGPHPLGSTNIGSHPRCSPRAGEPTGRKIYALRVPTITDAPDLEDLQPAAEVREGRFELPRPFAHQILRLLALRTDSHSTCRLVSFSCRSVTAGVVLL